VEEIKILHAKLRLQTINQNQKDLASYKDKLNFSVNKINEIESNLGELRHVQPDEGKKYEQISTFLSSSQKECTDEFGGQTQRENYYP
jgi:hypothetical protein